MLKHSKAESNEKKASRSLKDASWSISRFVLTAQVQCLSGLVEYVVVARRKGAYEFVCPTEVLPNFIFERFASVPEDWCTVIETVLLDNCAEHRSTNRLCVTLLEQWMLQPVHKSQSSIHSTSSIDTVFHEIKRYCSSSVLAHWLKGHPHTRRHKLTHRICTLREASPNLGVSFLMDRSELAGMFSLGDSESGAAGGCAAGDDEDDVHVYSPIDPVLLKQTAPPSNYRQSDGTAKSDGTGVNCPTDAAITTTSFPPVHIDTDRLLHVSVSSPQRLPASAPHCPFCAVCGAPATTNTAAGNRPHTVPLDLSMSASSSSSCTSSTSLSSQSDVAISDPSPEAVRDPSTEATSATTACRDSLGSWMLTDPRMRNETVSFLTPPSSLSSSSITKDNNNNNNPYTETVKSPMVVMTDAADQFFPSDMWSSAAATAFYHRFPSLLGAGFDSTGSGSSTLTKKSRTTTPPIEPVDLPLESPPRKQQRMVPTDPGGLDQAPTTVDTAKQGTMEKVIDKFIQMNVQRDEANGAARPPADLTATPLLSVSIPDTASSGTVNRSHEAKAIVPEASAGSSSKNLMEQVQRTGRRRNASSICVGAWPSWTRDSVPYFNRRTGLPLQSSPVPLKRSTSGKFDFDASLCPLKSSKSSICMVYGSEQRNDFPSAPLSSCTTSNAPSISSSTPQTPATRTNRNTISSTLDTSERPSTTTGNSPPSIHPRRRPASLKLTVPPTSHPPFTNGSTHIDDSDGGGSRHVVSGRRRNCPSDVDQAEMSCSAPPSGNRSLRLVTDRLANTLACTPVSHASSQHLLVNFEESMLNGRIHPVGQVDGFTLELGASGSFFPAHARIPMNAYFFDLSDDNTPSPYLGFADLSHLRHGKGYHVPKKGSVQLTLFNPNKFVVKMFVIGYDFEDMPPNSQTFLRQRTVYMPIQPTLDLSHSSSSSSRHTSLETPAPSSSDRHSVPNLFWAGQDSRAAAASVATNGNAAASPIRSSSSSSSCCCCSCCSCSVTSSRSSSMSSNSSTCSLASQHNHLHTNSAGSSVRTEQPAYLRYLVHLRFHTTRSGRLYLHTDLRLIFARDKFEFDPRVATYELRSFVDAPSNPRYSPKKWSKPHGSSMRHGSSTKTASTDGPLIPHIGSP